MPITIATYGYLDRNLAAPSLAIENLDPELHDFLRDHLDEVVRRFGLRDVGPANHTSAVSRTRFQRLLTGTSASFLKAAQELADSVHTEMVKKSNPNAGYFVAVRATADGRYRTTSTAAVLKLDVTDARLAQSVLRAGVRKLKGMKDVVEQPGKLQKGALVPDQRSASEVIVGERAREVAEYFLDGLGLHQDTPAGAAVGILLAKTRATAPQLVPHVAQELDAVTAPEDIGTFLDRAVTDPQVRARIAASVSTGAKRVVTIDPTAKPVTGEIVAGPVRITGPRDLIAAASWVRKGASGWTISIDVPQEPVRDFKA